MVAQDDDVDGALVDELDAVAEVEKMHGDPGQPRAHAEDLAAIVGGGDAGDGVGLGWWRRQQREYQAGAASSGQSAQHLGERH